MLIEDLDTFINNNGLYREEANFTHVFCAL